MEIIVKFPWKSHEIPQKITMKSGKKNPRNCPFGRRRKEPPHVALLQPRGRRHAEPRTKVPGLGELHLGLSCGAGGAGAATWLFGGELPTNRKWVSSPQFFEWTLPLSHLEAGL